MKAAAETLDGVVVKRPAPTRYHRQHLCLDKGYDYPEIRSAVTQRMYVPPHAPQRRDGEPGEALQAEEVGRGEERVVAEQVQEAPHQVGEEGRELSWTRPAGVLHHDIPED
jgi:putative transposase